MKMTKKGIEKFRNYLIEEEKSCATIEKYTRDISAFSLWLAQDTLDKTAVLSYKEYLMARYAPASVNSMLSSLNSFFDYRKWHHLKVKRIKMQRRIFAKKSRELSKEEYQKLLTAAKSRNNERLYYMMQTICGCGIRVSELSSITVEAVRMHRAEINCKGKIRVVILPDNLCKILLRYAKTKKITKGSVFVTKTGKPLDRSSIWKMMNALCEYAGVEKEKVFPHNLRHLFARTFYNEQKDVVRLADILGHSSIDTTRIYTMETGEIHRQQIQKLGLVMA